MKTSLMPSLMVLAMCLTGTASSSPCIASSQGLIWEVGYGSNTTFALSRTHSGGSIYWSGYGASRSMRFSLEKGYEWLSAFPPQIEGTTYVTAVNGSGVAVGSAVGDPVGGAATWDSPSTEPTLLGGSVNPVISARSMIADVISDTGVLAGRGTLRDDLGNRIGTRVVRWNSKSHNAEVLGVLDLSAGEREYAYPVALNNAGTIVGNVSMESAVFPGQYDLVVAAWPAGQTEPVRLRPAGTEIGASQFRVTGLNNTGVAVGSHSVWRESYGRGGYVGVKWDTNTGEATALQFPPAPYSDPQGDYVQIEDINDAGEIVGRVNWYPTRWDATGIPLVMESMPVPDGYNRFNEVYSINSSGWSVGYTAYGLSLQIESHAVLWDPNGKMHLLADLLPADSGWLLHEATQLSDDGWILGIGTFDPDLAGPIEPYGVNFFMHIPEPTSLVAMAAGGTAVLCRRRRESIAVK